MSDIGSAKFPSPSNATSGTHGPAIRFKLSTDGKAHIVQHFRLLQRCRDTKADPWDRAQASFEERVRETCEEEGGSDNDVRIVLEYFRLNWFCPEWRGTTLSYVHSVLVLHIASFLV